MMMIVKLMFLMMMVFLRCTFVMVVDVVVEILTVILDELFYPRRRCLPSKDTSRCEMMTNHNVNNHIRKSIPLQHPHIEEQKWIKCKHEVG